MTVFTINAGEEGGFAGSGVIRTRGAKIDVSLAAAFNGNGVIRSKAVWIDTSPAAAFNGNGVIRTRAGWIDTSPAAAFSAVAGLDTGDSAGSSVTTTFNTIGATSGNVNITLFNRDGALANNVVVASVGFYNTFPQDITIKIAQRLAAGSYNIVVSQVYTHNGTGWEDCALALPFIVPSSGTYHIGMWGASTNGPDVTSCVRAFGTGNFGLGAATLSENTSFGPAMRYTTGGQLVYVVTPGVAALSAEGFLAVDAGAFLDAGGAVLTAEGVLAVDGGVTLGVYSTFSAVGALTASAILYEAANALLAGSGALGVGTIRYYTYWGTANLAGSGKLDVAPANVYQFRQVGAVLSGNGAFKAYAAVFNPVDIFTPAALKNRFCFAWAGSDEIYFGPQHYREDEKIVSLHIEHGEGNAPTLSIDVKNPRIGLLNPGRNIWAWVSWRKNPTDVDAQPLFFGRLIGVPSNMFAEVVTLKFVSQALDYLARKQLVAETLKIRPYYDPIWLDPAHRDEPDSILEGWSALFHYDRITLAVTVSDIIDGEDGTVVFAPSDVPYDSVKLTVGQVPLSGVNVDATVNWTQQGRGIVDIGQNSFITYTGGSLISDWPKSESTLSAGWSVLSASAFDYFNISNAVMFSPVYNYQNNESQHAPGDTMAVNLSSSYPVTACPFREYPLIVETQTGYIDPDPDTHDIPTSFARTSFLWMPVWRVDTSLVLRYDAARQRSEHAVFTLMANLQPVISPPLSPPLPVEETIKVSSSDVGQPLTNVLDWLSVMGQYVSVGQVIYPNQPTLLGGTSYQICVQAGVAGLVEPTFSQIPGETVVDGSVVWASMGPNLNTVAGDHVAGEYYPIGSMIRPLTPIYARWQSLVPYPRLIGSQISQGQVCQASNGSFHTCTEPGTTGLNEPAFSTAYGAVTNDYTVQWTCIGTALPDGTNYFICASAGVSDPYVPPHYNNAVGATFPDGTGGLVWKSLGTAGNLIDVPVGDLSRRSYFPTARGLWSLEHLICLARAKLRMRARAITVDWDCSFAQAVQLSCRMQATLFDPRLPGGEVTGKVIKYELFADGDGSSMLGKVSIGSAVGYGGSVTANSGVPVYVDVGYVDGYQFYDGATVVIFGSSGAEVAYSIPVDAPDDDGLVFPLTKAQVIESERVWGSINTQIAAMDSMYPTVLRTAVLQNLAAKGFLNYSQQISVAQQVAFLSRFTMEFALAAAPIWYDLELKPLTNGPFNTEYQLVTSTLELPKQIDLEAPSNP